MLCKCGGETRVIDSRPEGAYIRRRRTCDTCTERFYTWETRYNPNTRKRSKDARGYRQDYMKAWRAANPEKVKAQKARAKLLKAAREEAVEKVIPVSTTLKRYGVCTKQV
jgi:transcriptional regulator NrdR family protein